MYEHKHARGVVQANSTVLCFHMTCSLVCVQIAREYHERGDSADWDLAQVRDEGIREIMRDGEVYLYRVTAPPEGLDSMLHALFDRERQRLRAAHGLSHVDPDTVLVPSAPKLVRPWARNAVDSEEDASAYSTSDIHATPNADVVPDFSPAAVSALTTSAASSGVAAPAAPTPISNGDQAQNQKPDEKVSEPDASG